MNTDLVWRMVRVFAVAGSVSYPGGEMPECRGQNARVLFGGDEITILREGSAAKLNFVDPHPWQIPVAALTGVDLQPPGPLHCGPPAVPHQGSTRSPRLNGRAAPRPTIVFFALLDGGSSRNWQQMLSSGSRSISKPAGTADMVELPPAPVSRSTVRRHATK